MATTERFHGHILGVGFADGTRCVLGHWVTTPLGSFADVMVERVDGSRLLIAPNDEVAEFVSSTYRFDEVVRTPVAVLAPTRAGAVVGPGRWLVDAGSLHLDLQVGGRLPLGLLLRTVPLGWARSPWFCRMTDLPARIAGARTAGTAGSDRREFYGALDLHRIDVARGSWGGVDLGPLRPVDPPVRFGFSSTLRTPSCTKVVTTIVRRRAD